MCNIWFTTKGDLVSISDRCPFRPSLMSRISCGSGFWKQSANLVGSGMCRGAVLLVEHISQAHLSNLLLKLFLSLWPLFNYNWANVIKLTLKIYEVLCLTMLISSYLLLTALSSLDTSTLSFHITSCGIDAHALSNYDAISLPHLFSGEFWILLHAFTKIISELRNCSSLTFQ